MGSFEFTRPAMLLLMLPMLAVAAYGYARSLSDFSKHQRIASLVTRLTMMLMLALGLSGLTVSSSTREQFVVVAVDQSMSVDGNLAEKATQYVQEIEAKKGQTNVVYLPFASRPEPISQSPPGKTSDKAKASPLLDPATPSPAEPGTKSGQASRDGTNLEAALEAAAGYIPPGFVPKIVLITDGNETQGNAVAAATRSTMPIATVPLPSRTEPEVRIAEVKVPSEVREGEPFFVETVVLSNHDDEGLLEIFQGDHKVQSERRRLKAGENRFKLQQSVERDRMAVFKVRISGLQQDTLLDNNADSGLVYTAGKPRVLIIESDVTLIQDLRYALEDEGIVVDVRPPQGMPDSIAALQNFELLMLSNVPATQITQQQMDVVRTWVQDLGGGFMMLGGEQSFGLGGYYKTTLEEILPVRSDFDKDKEKPSLGIVLVIDKSGSMQGEKLDMAKAAAQSAIELLNPKDQVAVIGFDGQTYVISEMQTAANRGQISEQIAGIQHGGGTEMFPAMQRSFELLNGITARLKHVIMLTDGISNSGDFEGLAQQMASAKITLSTVAVGGEGETDTQILESIARIGKGRFYETEDPSQVPQIFAKETITASKSAIDEQPFLPQIIRTTQALAEIDLESAPMLLGYVTTRPKPTCELILATEKGDPLLAWWRYGLGMTAAFTSDAKSRWAAEWLTWPGYGKFWTQIVRQLMRKSNTRGLQISAERHGQTTTLSIDATSENGRFINAESAEVTLIDPQLRRQVLKAQQTAPGRYTLDLSTELPGAYNISVAVAPQNKTASSPGGDSILRQSRGLMVGYSDELRILPSNVGLLNRIAEISGGDFNPSVESIFKSPTVTAHRPRPLWPTLLSIAALLLVADVALRRIDFSAYAQHFKQRIDSAN